MVRHQLKKKENFSDSNLSGNERDESGKALNSSPGAMRKVHPFDELSAIDDENLLSKHSRFHIPGTCLLNVKQFQKKENSAHIRDVA